MKRMASARLHCQRHVVEDAQIEKERRDLKRARQSERAPGMHGYRSDIAAREIDAPGVGPELAAELRDQRCLARSIRPDHGMQFTLGDPESEIVSSSDAPKRFARFSTPSKSVMVHLLAHL